MAFDTYTVFVPNSGSALTGESQMLFTSPATVDPFPGGNALTSKSFFPIADWSNDIEQTLSIGSTTTGAGAGKVAFNPFSITRNVDVISETIFIMCAAGTTFKYVDLILQKSTGASSAATFLAYRFGLVAVKTISWSHSDEAAQEVVAFEYGSLTIGYATQNPDGSYNKFVFAGWDGVKNVKL